MFPTGYDRTPRKMDSMDSKPKPQISVFSQAKANREVVTTPLFKLYQTKWARNDRLLQNLANFAPTRRHSFRACVRSRSDRTENTPSVNSSQFDPTPVKPARFQQIKVGQSGWMNNSGTSGSNSSAPTIINSLKLNRLSCILSKVNSLVNFYTVLSRPQSLWNQFYVETVSPKFNSVMNSHLSVIS